jgi:hypothetical protein
VRLYRREVHPKRSFDLNIGTLATSRSMKRREFLGTILAVPLRTLGNSAIEKCYGLLLLDRYGFIGPHKYKTGRHGDPRVGAAILADEY